MISTGVVQAQQKAPEAAKTPTQIALPAPVQGAPGSLEDVLAKRRSVREFSSKPLTQQQIGQLFWAAQGITHDGIKRAAPSAGAVYPLEIYVVTAEGLFHYIPKGHAMVRLSDRDLHQAVFKASNQQDMLQAPAVFVITGAKERMMKKYPAKAELYMTLEAGHVAENLLLEATAMGLVSVPAGGFVAADLQQGLSLPADEWAIYLIPVGYGK
jgi:SagB-type dehydrogenase family enzyme